MEDDLSDISHERLIEIIRDLTYRGQPGHVFTSYVEDYNLCEKWPELERIVVG